MKISDIHKAADDFVGRWGNVAPAHCEGRGIVTTLYDREFASGWVQLCEMKRLGITLPIEVFYRPGELSEEQIALVRGLGLDLDIVQIIDDVEGWAIKPFAIIHSRFREVLWLDSDNVPIRDPEFLFDDPEYVEKGSLFWRDVSGVDRSERWYPDAPVWKIMGVHYNDGEEFEAGQLLIDKSRCWQQLGLVIHFNEERDLYYQVVHGDKDTFRFAWLIIAQANEGYHGGGNYLAGNVPYGFMPFGPFHIGEPNPWGKWGGGSVMQQRDRSGHPLFNHRSINKFTLLPDASGHFRENDQSWKTYGPSEQEHYCQHLASLRSLLRASSPPNGAPPSEPSSASSPRPSPPSPRAASSSSALQIVWLPPVL